MSGVIPIGECLIRQFGLYICILSIMKKINKWLKNKQDKENKKQQEE